MLDVKSFAVGIIILAIAFGLGRWTAPEPIQPEPEVVTDTLRTSETFWTNIVKPDTVRDTLEIPVPTDLGGLNHYDVNYSDSLISSNIGLTVDGTVDEITYEYYLKRKLVTERKTEVLINRNIVTTRTKQQPRFQHSIQAGLRFDQDFDRGLYIEYRPEIRLGGVGIVGTAHVSNYSYLTVGVKFDL